MSWVNKSNEIPSENAQNYGNKQSINMLLLMIALVCLLYNKISRVFYQKYCGIQLESELMFCVFPNILCLSFWNLLCGFVCFYEDFVNERFDIAFLKEHCCPLMSSLFFEFCHTDCVQLCQTQPWKWRKREWARLDLFSFHCFIRYFKNPLP